MALGVFGVEKPIDNADFGFYGTRMFGGQSDPVDESSDIIRIRSRGFFSSSLHICFGRLAAQKITEWIGSLRFRFLRCGSLYWLFIFCMNTGYETRFWIRFKGCGRNWIGNFHEAHGFPRRKSEVVCRINFSEIALLDINGPCKRDLVDLIK